MFYFGPMIKEDSALKIVIATDSLKGSLSSLEAGNAIRAGICEADPHAQAFRLYLAARH